MLTRRRLLRKFNRVLREYAPRVATRTGLPEKPFTLVWSNITPVAATANRVIYLNYDNWFKSHPTDYGCLIHEYTHLIQAVPGGSCPGEVVEGIADAMRYMFGLYDPSWWSPSPMARQISSLSPSCFRALAQGMAHGAYQPEMLVCQ